MNTHCKSAWFRIVWLAIAPAALLQAGDAQSVDSIANSKDEPQIRVLIVDPAPEPIPALRYHLVPRVGELVPGNAAPIYLRLTHEQSDEWRTELSHKAVEWLALNAEEFPLDEAREYVRRNRYMAHQLKLAAVRDHCDWEYAHEGIDPIQILLPDAQMVRTYGRFLAVKARVDILDRRFDDAVSTLRAGIALGRNEGKAPFLINGLVGIAVARLVLEQVAELIAQPGSPNLYWALASVPRPVVDLRQGVEREGEFLVLKFPEIAHINNEDLSINWEKTLEKMTQWIGEVTDDPDTAELTRERVKDALAGGARLNAARTALIERFEYAALKVDKMSPAQIIVLYTVVSFHDWRDRIFCWQYLPYWQTHGGVSRSQRLADDEMRRQEIIPLCSTLLPAISASYAAQARLDYDFAILSAVEALRLHAAAEGKLPERFDEIDIVPVPISPLSGKAFDYQREGEWAILEGGLHEGTPTIWGRRYRIRLRGE